MIDNLVILSNVVLALWIIVRAILLDTQLGWFDPVGTPERGGDTGGEDANKRQASQAQRLKQRPRPGQQRDRGR